MREREGVYPIGSSRPEPSPHQHPPTHTRRIVCNQGVAMGRGGGIGVGLRFELRHRASSRCAGTETGHSDGPTRPQRRPASAVVPLPSPAPDRQSREQKKTRGWERSASCSGHPAARRNGPEAGLPQLRGRGRARRQGACWVPGPAPDCPGPGTAPPRAGGGGDPSRRRADGPPLGPPPPSGRAGGARDERRRGRRQGGAEGPVGSLGRAPPAPPPPRPLFFLPLER